MPATVAGIHLGPDTHANRPAADLAGLPVGALYMCSDHGLIYITDGSSWSTWASLSGGIAGSIFDAKGDVLSASADDTPAVLSVGANGSLLRAASGETTGLEWQKNNLAATAAPDADNDVDEGYTVGSAWFDTTNDEVYFCIDNSDGAAVWKQVGSGGGAAFVGCKIYRSSTQTLTTNTHTVITFDSEDFDTDTMHSTVTNTSRITVPSTGYYAAVGVVPFAKNGTGGRAAYIYLNGSFAGSGVNQAPNSSTSAQLVVSGLFYATSGQYFELDAYQNSGGDLSAGHASSRPNQCELAVYKVG